MNWKEALFIPIGLAIAIIVAPYFLITAFTDKRFKKEGRTEMTYVGNMQLEGKAANADSPDKR